MNAADVFVFWLAITSTLKDLFSKSERVTGITKTLKRKATAIINQRYKAFIDQSPSDIYFTAFFLDPRKSCLKFMCAYSLFHALGYARLGILKKPTNMSFGLVVPPWPTEKKPTVSSGPTGSSSRTDQGAARDESVPYPTAYKRAKGFLKDVLMKEVDMVKQYPKEMAGDILHKYTTAQIAERFVCQLVMYARGEWPFDLPHDENALLWWESLEKHPQADVLVVSSFSIQQRIFSLKLSYGQRLSIKIYLCLVNSMAASASSHFTCLLFHTFSTFCPNSASGKAEKRKRRYTY